MGPTGSTGMLLLALYTQKILGYDAWNSGVVLAPGGLGTMTVPAGALAASVAGGVVPLVVPEVLVPELVPMPPPVVPEVVVSDGVVVVVEPEVDVPVSGAGATVSSR